MAEESDLLVVDMASLQSVQERFRAHLGDSLSCLLIQHNHWPNAREFISVDLPRFSDLRGIRGRKPVKTVGRCVHEKIRRFDNDGRLTRFFRPICLTSVLSGVPYAL